MSDVDEGLTLRTEIAGVLTAAGIQAVEYVATVPNPPCAAVVPHQPYLRWPRPGEQIPFGHLVVSIDVLLIAGRETSKKVAAQMDQMIWTATKALRDYDVTQVSQPGVVTLNSAKLIGSVLTIDETTREP